jgi:hypothetical protein
VLTCEADSERNWGRLVATDRRLLFVWTDPLLKLTHQVIDMPYRGITSLNGPTGIALGKLDVTMAGANYHFHLMTKGAVADIMSVAK